MYVCTLYYVRPRISVIMSMNFYVLPSPWPMLILNIICLTRQLWTNHQVTNSIILQLSFKRYTHGNYTGVHFKCRAIPAIAERQHAPHSCCCNGLLSLSWRVSIMCRPRCASDCSDPVFSRQGVYARVGPSAIRRFWGVRIPRRSALSNVLLLGKRKFGAGAKLLFQQHA